ncbi:DHA3 family macrolide efflux protein-like MFS transporter [Oxalobacteraceae bacterium GrIS 1.11]
MKSTFSILLDREYKKYAAASILTSVGTGMQFVAISWFLYKLSGSSSSIGWMLIVATLPGILFSPWIGTLVDRWDARLICIGSDIVRGVVLLFLVTCMYLGKSSATIIYGCAFLIAICDNFFQPAVGSLVRNIVVRERLLSANIIGNMSMQIGIMTGASIGGLLVARYGALLVVCINMVSFFVSAVLIYWINTKYQKNTSSGKGPKIGFFAEFKATRNYIATHSNIIWLAMLQMFVYLTLYICNTLLPAFVDKELAGGAAGFGMIDAAWGVGAMLGGFALTYVARRIDRRLFGLAGLLLMSAAIFIFLTARAVPQAVCAYLMLGFLTCMIRVNTDTILVTEVDPQYFGKVKATITMFISYIGLGVYGSVGYIGDHISIRSIYLALGLAIFFGFFVAVLPRVGLRRPQS